jgi:hypothetical protein
VFGAEKKGGAVGAEDTHSRGVKQGDKFVGKQGSSLSDAGARNSFLASIKAIVLEFLMQYLTKLEV